ncbi:hypothetical protein DVH05_005873 [Phytophthora capsici]|nr:hypothetical protein DVH05_005873 [Phytophthora capsici]
MKIIKAVVQREPPPRWGYLAIMAGMLYLLRRSKIKDIPRENVLSFFAAMLPTELSHNLLAINAAIIYYAVGMDWIYCCTCAVRRRDPTSENTSR